MPRYVTQTLKPAVAQEYLPPLLLNGKKFDLRLYALLTSVDPLEAYLHSEGLARFCAEPYEPPNDDNLRDAFKHLTNYSLNKKSTDFVHMSAAKYEAATGRVRLAKAMATEVTAAEATAAATVGAAAAAAPTAAAAKERAGAMRMPTSAAPLTDVSNGVAPDASEGVTSNGAIAAAANGTNADSDARACIFAGCSKRPLSVVLDELATSGLIEHKEALWTQIVQLVRLTLVALQPELGARHRQSFIGHSERGPSLAQTAAPSEAMRAHSRRAFHLLGIDVLLDSKGRPRLLEVNSNPSLSITHDPPPPVARTAPEAADESAANEATGQRSATAAAPADEVSPVDLLVKRRVLTDALRLVASADGASPCVPKGWHTIATIATPGATGTGAGTGTGTGTGTCTAAAGSTVLPRSLTLVDRCRRLYGAFMRWANPLAGMDASQFNAFCQRAGILSLVDSDERRVASIFRRACADDESRLPAHAFSCALQEFAHAAYGGRKDLTSERGERLEQLLSHIETCGDRLPC